MGSGDLMRDMISGVAPVSVMQIMAFTPSRWLAAYMADRAMASSMRVMGWWMRCLERWVAGFFSAPTQILAMASTAAAGYCPIAVSAESMTASVSSNTALATSD